MRWLNWLDALVAASELVWGVVCERMIIGNAPYSTEGKTCTDAPKSGVVADCKRADALLKMLGVWGSWGQKPPEPARINAMLSSRTRKKNLARNRRGRTTQLLSIKPPKTLNSRSNLNPKPDPNPPTETRSSNSNPKPFFLPLCGDAALMMRSLFAAATGMDAQQRQINTVSNNLANVTTTGFKKSRNNFQDLLYEVTKQAGAPSSPDTSLPAGIHSGHGVKLVSTQKLFEQGDIKYTGAELDMAIEGIGFYQILQPNGVVAYSRAGNFERDPNGRVVTPDGFPLLPEIVIPETARQIQVGLDGNVSVLLGDETLPTAVGAIELSRFVNPAGLTPVGKNLFLPTAASGEPQNNTPGLGGMGSINHQFLELSNVSVVEEMVSMIVTQRAYEINSKAIQTSDEMLETANNLVR